MEHCSYRHSNFYILITLLRSSVESHLSNKPKQVFFNPINIFDTFTHSITLLYIFNLFSFNVNFFNLKVLINLSVVQVTRISLHWVNCLRRQVDVSVTTRVSAINVIPIVSE